MSKYLDTEGLTYTLSKIKTMMNSTNDKKPVTIPFHKTYTVTGTNDSHYAMIPILKITQDLAQNEYYSIVIMYSSKSTIITQSSSDAPNKLAYANDGLGIGLYTINSFMDGNSASTKYRIILYKKTYYPFGDILNLNQVQMLKDSDNSIIIGIYDSDDPTIRNDVYKCTLTKNIFGKFIVASHAVDNTFSVESSDKDILAYTNHDTYTDALKDLTCERTYEEVLSPIVDYTFVNYMMGV